MLIGNEKGRATMNITENEEILEQVMSFLYLGHIVKDNGKSETHVKKKNRIGVPKNTFNKT